MVLVNYISFTSILLMSHSGLYPFKNMLLFPDSLTTMEPHRLQC